MEKLKMEREGKRLTEEIKHYLSFLEKGELKEVKQFIEEQFNLP